MSMTANATLENFNMPTTVAVTTIGRLTVSTVNLNDAALGGSSAFETCVFYPNGHNNVVGRWATEAEALTKHVDIVKHEVSHIVARLDLHVI
jgi:hypothetical protein